MWKDYILTQLQTGADNEALCLGQATPSLVIWIGKNSNSGVAVFFVLNKLADFSLALEKNQSKHNPDQRIRG